MTTTINLDHKFTDEFGKEIQNSQTLAVNLASRIAMSKGNRIEPLKAWLWATSLAKTGKIEMDDANKKTDTEMLVNFVNTEEHFFLFQKAQFINAIQGILPANVTSLNKKASKKVADEAEQA